MTRSRRLRELEKEVQARKKHAERSVLASLRKERQELSKPNKKLRGERDFKEAPLRAGWPTLTPLPIRSYDAFPVGEPQLLPDRGFHIQRVRSLCGKLGIQTRSIEVVLRVPVDDLDSDICRVTQLGPEHTKLPLEEYMTMLVTLDFKEYGRQIPTALLAVRRLFMRSNATNGLMIEFLDYNCGWAGLQQISIHPVRNELACQALDDELFNDRLLSLIKDQRWCSISSATHFKSKKAFQERVDRWWTEGDDGGQPIICISARDADDPKWWNTVLPALRKWLKSDELFSQYGVRFEVVLVLQARGPLC
jgi:hypothetical protein